MARNKLKPKQVKLLNALFTERTIKDAYKKVGISVATGDRYRKDPVFINQYEKQKKALINATNDHLRALSSKAVEALSIVLNDPEAADSDKIRAAKAVLDTTYKNVELEELRSQVEQLERQNNGGF